MRRTGKALSVLAVLALAGTVEAQHRTGNDEFTMALTGDTIITRRLSVYDEPEFLEMIELIRSADVAFTNLEILFHDYEPYPMAVSGGTWMRADPVMAKELVWAGFDMVARANNHTGDYGVHGMELTTKYVEDAGLVHAGVGHSLAEAREAKFLETTKARVALVSVSSSFARHMSAGRSRDNVPPRPGLNPLEYTTTNVVTRDEFDSLKAIGDELGQFTNQDGQPRGIDAEKPDEFRLFGRKFVVGDETAMRTEPNEDDVAEIAAVINNASRLADFVIVTIHAHEGPTRGEPADFLQPFARAMIDAGADVFVGHGPHALRGIEIYNGQPIFYSLGDFMFQNETLDRLPSDNYEALDLNENHHVADFNDRRYENDTKGFPTVAEVWEAVIAVPRFRNRELVEVALYPIDLAFGEPVHVRGRPLLADDELGEKILEYLQARSDQYGTDIEIRRGVGYIKID